VLTVMVNSGTSVARLFLYPDEYPPAAVVVAAADELAGVPTNWNPDQTPKILTVFPLESHTIDGHTRGSKCRLCDRVVLMTSATRYEIGVWGKYPCNKLEGDGISNGSDEIVGSV